MGCGACAVDGNSSRRPQVYDQEIVDTYRTLAAALNLTPAAGGFR
jgi:hypothetical protein